MIVRKQSRGVKVGDIMIGGQRPVVVQSMTNTDTADTVRTSIQIAELARAGSELVRITVNNNESAAAVPEIRERLAKLDCDVPLVGDFHFNGHKLLADHPACAEALAKFRINPGNVGKGNKRDHQFASMIVELNELYRNAVIRSALESAQQAEEIGLSADKIIVSCKMSRVQDLISVYTQLSESCDYALHLGLTEAGMGSKGIVASTAALGVLLQQGIGDTIRISLTPEPGGDRTREVIVAQEILQTMGLRSFTPMVTACPGCGRTTSTVFQQLAEDIQTQLRDAMPEWKTKYAGVENMTVAVMGCVVNTGERPVAPVYVDGEKTVTLKGDNIAAEFQDIVQSYVVDKYSQTA